MSKGDPNLYGDIARRQIWHRDLLHIVGAVRRKGAPAAYSSSIPLHHNSCQVIALQEEYGLCSWPGSLALR